MDSELKRRWVEALRSGDYTQGRCELRNEQGHCCLGVLREVMDGSEVWSRGLEQTPDGEVNVKINYEPIQAVLGDVKVSTFWSMNDSYDSALTFPQIADWIEENIGEDSDGR